MMNLQMCLAVAYLICKAYQTDKTKTDTHTHKQRCRQIKQMSALPSLHAYSTGQYSTPPPTVSFPLPAERVLAADPPQLQTIGFFLIFVGAIRHDSLPASFSAALTLAGAEEQPVAELSGHAVQE